MQGYFRNLLLLTIVGFWANGALASPLTQHSFRYAFTVTGSEISYSAAFLNTGTNTLVNDPALTQTLTEQMHPLRDAIGQTGAVVLEMAYKIDNIGTFAETDWLQVDCLSGFLCGLTDLYARYTDHSLGSPGSATSGFGLYGNGGDINWNAVFDGAGGGTLRYDGDDFNAGTNSASIDGTTYVPTSNAQALFQLSNISVIRLDGPGTLSVSTFPQVLAQPVVAPLPASAFMLLTALGGGFWVAHRRRRA